MRPKNTAQVQVRIPAVRWRGTFHSLQPAACSPWDLLNIDLKRIPRHQQKHRIPDGKFTQGLPILVKNRVLLYPSKPVLVPRLGVKMAGASPKVSGNTEISILLEVDILPPRDDIGDFYFLRPQAEMKIRHGLYGEALQHVVPYARRKSKLVQLVIQIIRLNGNVLPIIVKGIHPPSGADGEALVVKIKLKRTVPPGRVPVTRRQAQRVRKPELRLRVLNGQPGIVLDFIGPKHFAVGRAEVGAPLPRLGTG